MSYRTQLRSDRGGVIDICLYLSFVRSVNCIYISYCIAFHICSCNCIFLTCCVAVYICFCLSELHAVLLSTANTAWII